mmetsp:Transcript_96970/g.278623  ORF Transcript_96970/g.278623 Transcript_96970/m.278623 type:complete len:263 (-) Transcript_96970:578-1366(-)
MLSRYAAVILLRARSKTFSGGCGNTASKNFAPSSVMWLSWMLTSTNPLFSARAAASNSAPRSLKLLNVKFKQVNVWLDFKAAASNSTPTSSRSFCARSNRSKAVLVRKASASGPTFPTKMQHSLRIRLFIVLFLAMPTQRPTAPYRNMAFFERSTHVKPQLPSNAKPKPTHASSLIMLSAIFSVLNVVLWIRAAPTFSAASLHMQLPLMSSSNKVSFVVKPSASNTVPLPNMVYETLSFRRGTLPLLRALAKKTAPASVSLV